MLMQTIGNSTNNLNFGMAVKISPEAKKYIKTNFNDRQLNELDKIIENQKNNKYDILISTKNKDVSTGWKDNGKTWGQVFKKVEYLVASVKEREFKKGILTSDISTIKKAEKYSNKLQNGEKLDVDKILNKAETFTNKLNTQA